MPGGPEQVLQLDDPLEAMQVATLLDGRVGQGFAVTVLEKQPSPREVGAGLGLWVNAVRALKRIGVGDPVESIVVPDRAGGLDIRYLGNY